MLIENNKFESKQKKKCRVFCFSGEKGKLWIMMVWNNHIVPLFHGLVLNKGCKLILEMFVCVRGWVGVGGDGDV